MELGSALQKSRKNTLVKRMYTFSLHDGKESPSKGEGDLGQVGYHFKESELNQAMSIIHLDNFL